VHLAGLETRIAAARAISSWWDNAAVQHRANFDYDLPLRRVMHRTTVRGSVPF
jgi:hypothetical protein